jgi:hypothetical protein
LFVHPQNDPGCLNDGHHFLRTSLNRSAHALVLFDREAAVVLEPELEIWVWSDSPHVAEILGWKNRQTDLNRWLREKGFLHEGEIKPDRPKESMEAALKRVRKPRSSVLYQRLAEKISFGRCTDEAFNKFKTTLQNWFSR